MRRYKAVVIDGRKVIRRAAFVLAAGGLLVLFATSIGSRIARPERLWNPQGIVAESVPVIESLETSIGASLKGKGRKLLSFFLQFDLWDPSTVLAAEIPLAQAVNRTGMAILARGRAVEKEPLPEVKKETELPRIPTEIPSERQAPIKEVNAVQKTKGTSRVVLGNETSYQVEPEELLKTPPSIHMTGEGPKVLVIHTHATEAYAPEGSTVYDTEGNDRSENSQENVVKVGEVLVQVLREKGIETIHDTKFHDTPSFNGSYASSLKAIESYLAKYPSIQVVLDIHRDSIVYGDGTKAKLVTEINGEAAAQLMFVVGTDQKGLEHPNWRENIKSAVHFQNAICERYPTLMRHINLRRERFNGHTSKASMIIETGSSGNSLSEAIYGITLAGECIADYLNSL